MAFLKVPARRKVKAFAVIGLGNFGATVARELASLGNQVIGIDLDEARLNAHADALTQAMLIDARDDAALREAGIGDCATALVAMGDDLESSILAAINLKTLGVPKVWAKATTKTHHRILAKLKVDRVIHPEEEVGRQIAQVLHNPNVRDFVGLGNGYRVMNFLVPEPLDGACMSKLAHGRFELRCLGVMRGTEYLGRDGETFALKKDDRLILLGRRADLQAFAEDLPCP